MANKYIGDLTAITTLANNDEFVVNQASDAGTKKITYSNLRNVLGFEDAPTRLTATLAAGSTTVTFSDASITTSSLIEPFTDQWGISPTDITVTTGQAVLTFPTQASSISVLILVR